MASALARDMADSLDLRPDAADQELLAQVVAYYCQALKNSPDAVDYLRARGIDAHAIDYFRIGYCDRSLGLLLPSKKVKAGLIIRSRLLALGVLRPSGHEHFRGSITFPVLDADGRIVDIYGRKRLGTHLRKGTAQEVYLAPERRGVWNMDAFLGGDEIILCSSLWDALAFWSHGYRNVSCTLNADALTEDHLAAFKQFKTQRVLTTAADIMPRLLAAGLDCYLLKLPRGLDINAYALQANDPAEALGAVLRKAEWAGNGKKASPLSDAATVTQSEPKTAVEDEAVPAATASVPAVLASPLPPAPPEVIAEVRDEEVHITFGSRRYRVRGWASNLSLDQLKVNILVTCNSAVFADTFDLYAAKYRRAFVVQAAQEFGVDQECIKKDLGRLLLALEELQAKQVREASEPKEVSPAMTERDKDAALELLRDPRLLDRILADSNLVGENANKLLCYLAAISRKLEQPLAVIIQSSSAAGKTALMEATLALTPPEDVVKFSAMTGQSLFYMGTGNLRHKVLAIVEEEGAQRASYALKLLQSEGELRIASTGKDSTSGRMITQEYTVQGPVMIFQTTTAIKVDEELLNRSLVLTVNEDRKQTRAIHRLQRQRETLNGLLAAQAHQETLKLHCNAQRLLKPLLVANPFAESLTFLDDKTRTRRDHVKYLTLIRAITLLHQHQRPIQTVEHQGKAVEYIEVTVEDIEVANRLANEVLGRSVDDLPPQTRRLFELIDAMVMAACEKNGLNREDYHFSRRDVREYTGWGQTQLKVHLKRLEELELLLVHKSPRGQSRVYELLFGPSTRDRKRFLAKLIDVQQLRANGFGYDDDRSGQNGQRSGLGRPEVGGVSAGGRGEKTNATACLAMDNANGDAN